jgi:hypothetical protein
MKTFDDLEFKGVSYDLSGGGVRACMQFDNGYQISVVKNTFSYGGPEGLYEAAVLNRNGSINYDTPVTDDVIGHLTPEKVTDVMRQIQELKPAE